MLWPVPATRSRREHPFLSAVYLPSCDREPRYIRFADTWEGTLKCRLQPDACGRRKRGYATAPPDASTHGSTVYRGRNHSQAAWYCHRATPWWQVLACVVVASLPQPAQQKAVSEAHITTNAAGHRCGGYTSATRHTARNGHHLVQCAFLSLFAARRSATVCCGPVCCVSCRGK